ncbi:conserved hypothetical protein [Perkinsus marinus ATCC 50983]|uniref:Uncharacterized protein n=1 Tax=Perkinsus marinus (strain ATCC 50983 / TXsc) TaxID=423536 RepID=C5KJN6_PERM5|nr:conserved hypothetical protein [Perkinsus marinus ATCC 50983]EER15370.1 conserved hypothetical protein [Perkinsus marinus ATCC 50983]|eukprot:XP_002783574.1 conserved hypothetical protein [Perkinsus marinus ATCC 50983]
MSSSSPSSLATASTASESNMKTGLKQFHHRLMEHWILPVFGITAYSMLGTASRIAITDGTKGGDFFSSYSYFAANCTGSLVMGLINGIPDLKAKCPGFHHGMTVGFCGCFTTFSSWIYAIVKSPTPSIGAVEFFSGMSMPFISWLLGNDIGAVFVDLYKDREPWFSDKTWYLIDKVLVFFPYVFTALLFPLIATQGVFPPSSVYASLLSPIGAVPRWISSSYLNSLWPQFPLGTFIANLFAVAFDGILMGAAPGNTFAAYCITGIGGSWSTVSSFVNDTFNLYRKEWECKRSVAVNKFWVYWYLTVSVGISLSVAAIVHACTE